MALQRHVVRLSFAHVTSPGDPGNEVVFAKTDTTTSSHLLFQDTDGTGPANVAVAKLATKIKDNCFCVAQGQTITVGEFSNTTAVPGEKIFASLGKGTTVLPADSCGLAVRTDAETVEFLAPTDGLHPFVDFSGKTPQAIVAGKNGQSVANVPTTCGIFAPAGKSVTVFNANGSEILAAEGSVVASAAWRELPVLWLDASAADTLHGLGQEALPADKTNVGEDPSERYMTTYTNGLKLVEGWVDCRGRDCYRGFNTRLYNDVGLKKWSPIPQCYPYAVPNGLNGMTYLTFSTRAGNGVGGTPYANVDGTTLADGGQVRRMPFCLSGTKTEARIPATLVTMVFGSQQGGGAATPADITTRR